HPDLAGGVLGGRRDPQRRSGAAARLPSRRRGRGLARHGAHPGCPVAGDDAGHAAGAVPPAAQRHHLDRHRRGRQAGLRAARRNKPYLRLVGTHFIQSCSLACSYTMVAFIFIYAIGKIDLLLPFVLVMSAAALAAQPFWLSLSRRIGKRSAFLIACAGWVGVTLSWLVVRPGSDVLLTLPYFGPLASEHLWVLLRAVVIGITNSGFLLLMLSLLTDAIKLGGEPGANDDEGLLSGMFSAIEKLAFAVGPLLAGFALSLSGFASSTTGMAQQSAQVVSSIVLLYSVVPATGMVISLLVFGLRRR
ncbi:MAG: hypothetical protein EOP35_13565, partial [Rubrivivax sp.]